MRHRHLFAAACVLVAVCASGTVARGGQGLPLKGGKRIVAAVNDDVITLSQFLFQLDPDEDARRLTVQGQATESDLNLLDRLITVRLIVQESQTMGIAELPEIRRQADVTSRSILREVLMETLVKDVTADESAVDAAFKDLTKEWRTTSVLFADEPSARQTRDEIAGGADFNRTVARAVAEKKATTEGDESYHRQKEYVPEIGREIAKLDVGQVTSVIALQAGFVIVKVVDVRYPDTADARAQARRTATAQKRQAVLDAQERALRAKYVVVHDDVLASIDYEAKAPGLDALGKDTRVVADIKGSDPLTVADLTEYLKLQFFHGGDDAAQAKRMNSKKQVALDATLARRVLNLEAARRGIEKTDSYLDRVKAFDDSLVFDTFVQKVIAPDSKVREADVKGYYDAHLKDYSYPGMVRLRTLAFTKRAAAEGATEKLRKGTDYAWLAANADDQVAAPERSLSFEDGQLLMFDTLPEQVRQALADPKPGDFRLYAHPDGQFYVFAVQDVVAPSARPFAEVREDIAKKLYAEKLKKGVEDYAAKLRTASRINVYLRKVS